MCYMSPLFSPTVVCEGSHSSVRPIYVINTNSPCTCIDSTIHQFDRWRACEQHRDNTADKLLLTTVDMDCIEYWNLYSN